MPTCTVCGIGSGERIGTCHPCYFNPPDKLKGVDRQSTRNGLILILCESQHPTDNGMLKDTTLTDDDCRKLIVELQEALANPRT